MSSVPELIALLASVSPSTLRSVGAALLVALSPLARAGALTAAVGSSYFFAAWAGSNDLALLNVRPSRRAGAGAALSSGCADDALVSSPIRRRITALVSVSWFSAALQRSVRAGSDSRHHVTNCVTAAVRAPRNCFLNDGRRVSCVPLVCVCFTPHEKPDVVDDSRSVSLSHSCVIVSDSRTRVLPSFVGIPVTSPSIAMSLRVQYQTLVHAQLRVFDQLLHQPG